MQSQFHTAPSGMRALTPSAIKRVQVEYVIPPLGPRNATGSPTAPTEIPKSNSSNMLQTKALSQCPQSSISPSHFSGDHTHQNMKHLEQLLDSSLATAAVIQSSGNALADVLTPHAYGTFKALYALADLDAPALSTGTKTNESEIPTRSTFTDIGNDCTYSSNRSPPGPLPNSSLAVPHTNRIQISISLDHVMLFSWAGLVAISFFVLLLICFYDVLVCHFFRGMVSISE